MQSARVKSAGVLIDAAVRGELDPVEALRLYKECLELVTLALPAAARRIAERDVRIAKKLRRLLRDGMRLRKRPDFTPERYSNRINRLNRRVGEMAREEHADADARRLTKRLRRYGEYLFTFLDYPYVTADNDFGEGQVRPAVISRKNSQSNRSDRGAATQAVLMSAYRTLRLRGLNPTKTIVDALRTYLTTGQLPRLPP